MDDTLADGSWNAVRKLNKPPGKKQGRLRNLQGELVDASSRAETLAEYLESVQWTERFADLTSGNARNFDEELPVNLDAFTADELKTAVEGFKRNKATGGDQIPMEFWMALISDQHATERLLQVCNECWASKSIPQS